MLHLHNKPTYVVDVLVLIEVLESHKFSLAKADCVLLSSKQ